MSPYRHCRTKSGLFFRLRPDNESSDLAPEETLDAWAIDEKG